MRAGIVCRLALLVMGGAACSGSGSDASPASVCGDGVAEAGEGCDGADLRGQTCADFGFDQGQLGCFSVCAVDLGGCALTPPADAGADTCEGSGGVECEPNDTTETATTLSVEGGHAEVRGAVMTVADVDMYAVVVPAGQTGRIVARLEAPGEDGCPDGRLELATPDGRVVVLAGRTHDQNGYIVCAAFDAAGLPPGISVVRVRAGYLEEPFTYRLSVELELEPCGDRVADPGQECDDGNQTDGDGCSACRLETVLALEAGVPLAAAPGPLTPPFAVTGELSVAREHPEDHQWVAIALDRPASLRVVLASPDCGLMGFAGSLDRLVEDQLETLAGSSEPMPPPRCIEFDLGPQQLDPGVYYLELLGYLQLYGLAASAPYRAAVTYASLCGNGVVEPPEECDGDAQCDERCQLVASETCGDGQPDEGEECDDGNRMDGDGCSARCRNEGGPGCGDGVLAEGEECDDGNQFPGDCCSPACRFELGCEIEPNDGPGTATYVGDAPGVRGSLASSPGGDLDEDWFSMAPGSGDILIDNGVMCAAPPGLRVQILGPPNYSQTAGETGCVQLRATVRDDSFWIVVSGDGPATYDFEVSFISTCGDGIVSGTETCDDLTPECLERDCVHTAVCGDGIVTAPETCDDGNLDAGDECGPTCGTTSETCGNRVLDPGEECDDGGQVDGDGCSAVCTLEPSCGDGAVDPPEECDDGGRIDGDGCSADCALEPGHVAESEPNDDGTPSVANSDFRALAADGPFDSDVTIHAAIEPFGDDDVFAVTNPGASAVNVTAATFGRAGVCAGVDTQLRVRNANANLLAFDDDSGPDACSRLVFAVPPGETRYVHVTDAGDNSLIPAYILELRFNR